MRARNDLRITFVIENNGEGRAYAINDVSLKIYSSTDTVLSSNDSLLDSHDVPTVDLEGDETFAVPLNTSTLGLYAANDYNNISSSSNDIFTTHIICVIEIDDPDEDIDVNLNNNIFSFEVLFLPFSSKDITDTIIAAGSTPYPLEIYDLSGRLLYNGTIENEEDEESIKRELPSNLYIIKSNNKTYKFYK